MAAPDYGKKAILQDARDAHLACIEMCIPNSMRYTSHTTKVGIFCLIYKYLSYIKV